MPRGRVLTPEERAQITRLHAAGVSGREIAKKLRRSKTVVLNFLRAPTQYASAKRSGRKRTLSEADEARLHAALFRTPPPHAEPNADKDAALLASDAGSPADVEATGRPVKMSAEQIKREFNVPLSVRRIQQLLCEWRRQAQRQQSEQRVQPSQQSQEDREDASAAGRGAGGGDDLTTAVVTIQASSDADVVQLPLAEEAPHQAAARTAGGDGGVLL